MAEVYSSLYKGNVHVTTPFSASHPAIDMGNYKTRNPIFSPNKLGKGKVTKLTKSYTYQGVTYKNTLTMWFTYDSGFEMTLVHGHPDDQVVNVGDVIVPGQQIYRTGNTGYSKGDHLHCQLKKNGVLVDPSPYVLNDKFILFNPGQRFEFTDSMNLRDSAYKDIGDIAKGAVGEITSVGAYKDNYQWYGIKFGNASGLVADTERNQITTKAMTNINGSAVTPPVDPCDAKVQKAIADTSAKYEKELEAKNQQIQKLEENNKLLTERNVQLESQADQDTEVIKDLNAEISELTKISKDLSAENKELKKALEECKGSNSGCLPFLNRTQKT